MTDAEKTVFISYRRDVSSYIARAIFLDLRSNGYDVFMDVESVDSGTFDTIILNQIEARGHFVLVLTPGSVERCVEVNDWLRREVEYAIDKHRNIVPVLANGFAFNGTEQYLTGKLSELQRYNALPLYHEYFDEAMARLRSRFLKQPIYGEVAPAPIQEQPVVEQKIEVVASQPAPTEAQLSAEEYFSRAYEKHISGDFDGAIADYDEALRLNPEFVAAYYNRGTARGDKGDLDGALADYNQAIRLNPQYTKAYVNRGTARSRNGDLDGAIADYDEAIRLNPQLAEAYYNRGLARQAKGDLDGAIADFDEAIYVNPQYANAYRNRGLARQAKGDLDGAIADYDEAIFLNPQDADTYNNRGGVRYHRGDLDGALADYSEALRLNPQNPSAYNNRGEVYFALNKYDLALSDFLKSNELRPAHKYALAGLAITHHALSQIDEAKRLWSILLAQDERYNDADWVGKELNWAAPLVEEARKLIAKL